MGIMPKTVKLSDLPQDDPSQIEATNAKVREAFKSIAPAVEQVREIQEKFRRIAEPVVESLKKHQLLFKKIADEERRAKELMDSLKGPKPIALSAEMFRPQPVYASFKSDDYDIIADKVAARISPKPVIPQTTGYYLPVGAVWEKLRIKFVDGHTVKVRYPDIPTRTFDFKQMGFEDRKTHNPDTKWAFLRAMSERGSITLEKFDRRFNRTVKYETNERFKKFFGMNKDAFEPYAKKTGYRPAFALFPEHGQTAFEDENVI